MSPCVCPVPVQYTCALRRNLAVHGGVPKPRIFRINIDHPRSLERQKKLVGHLERSEDRHRDEIIWRLTGKFCEHEPST